MTEIAGTYPYFCQQCESRVFLAGEIKDGKSGASKTHGFTLACDCHSEGQHMSDGTKPPYWMMDFDEQVGDSDD